MVREIKIRVRKKCISTWVNFFMVPMAGSSNVESGLATGTIFGILRHPAHLQDSSGRGKATPDTLLQPGLRLVAAGWGRFQLGAGALLVELLSYQKS